jgi:two-component system heavy metal sensor histidine kinase CusS
MQVRVGFRGSIAAVATTIGLITLGGAFSAIAFVVNRSQETQFDQALLEVADAEATDLALHPAEDVSISDRPGPSANEVGPLPLFGALFSTDSRVLSLTPTFQGAAPVAQVLSRPDRRPFDLSWQGQHLRGVLVAVSARQARLLVAAPRADLDSDAAFLRRAMILVFAVAVAWTAGLAFAIASRMTRTHRGIVSTAQRVVAGDLSARVHATGRRGEMSELGRNIDEMIERLVVLVGRQQQFIAHAAHELRSPIATLYGELSHALRRPRNVDEYQLAIERALHSTRRLKDMAEDLLTLARLGARVPQATTEVALLDTVRDAIEQVRSASEQRRVLVDVGGDTGNSLRVQGRAGDLTRLFRNLIENAIRHSPEGAAVVIHLSRVGDEARVEVSDQGPGIPLQDREAIFVPFFHRPEVAGPSAGAGLGLPIARDIALLHQGELTVSDLPGRPGACFLVRLPIYR